MSEYQTSLVFSQLALVPFPDSSDFGRCLKSECKKSESELGQYIDSIQTTCVWFKSPKSCLKLEFPSLRISAQFGFWSFSIQTFTVQVFEIIFKKELCSILFRLLKQGNLYTGGRLLYRLCSRQPTVELAVGVLKIFFYNQ